MIKNLDFDIDPDRLPTPPGMELQTVADWHADHPTDFHVDHIRPQFWAAVTKAGEALAETRFTPIERTQRLLQQLEIVEDFRNKLAH